LKVSLPMWLKRMDRKPYRVYKSISCDFQA
jgi:hypothetical protein